MSGKKKGHGGGGHGAAWVVTFADLMALLMAFFVMIVSFSSTETEAMKQAAGSVREAFGIQPFERQAGMIERDGLPVRDYLLSVSPSEPTEGFEFSTVRDDADPAQGPEANTNQFERADEDRPREFLTAAASLRQALQDLPDIAEISRQIMVEEDDEGLHIIIVDQDGRSMFASGSRQPETNLVEILQRMAPVLQAMPNGIRIVGHTEAGPEEARPGTAAWQLSSDRALETARVLGDYGLSADHLSEIVGVADTQPLFPNDPYLSSNRRIEIVLLSDAPPLPSSFRP